MDIAFLDKLKLDYGGKVLQFGDLNLQDYESILKDRYELDEFGKGKYPFSNVPPTNYGVKATMRHGDGNKEIEMVAPNEILPGDYICRVNDFEVNLETTQEEIFNIIRNTLLSVDGTSGKKAKKTKVMLQRKKQCTNTESSKEEKMNVVHLTIARNHHPNQQLGPMYKPPTTILFQLEPPPAVFWSSFMDVETGMNMNDSSNSHACRVKSVAPKSVSSQFGVRANDQIVQVGTRPILGSGRNNLISDWIKTDITRSQYGEAIVQFARPHPKSTKQSTHTSYLADIVHNASKVRYPQPYYLYRNEMVKFDDYLSRVMHSTLTMESLQKYVDELGKVDGVDFFDSCAAMGVCKNPYHQSRNCTLS